MNMSKCKSEDKQVVLFIGYIHKECWKKIRRFIVKKGGKCKKIAVEE